MLAESSPSSAEEAIQLLETMPVGFIYWDRQWRCIGVNAQGERLSGKTASELFGHSLWQLFPDVVGTEFETVYRRVAVTGRPENLEIFYPESINRWLDIYVTVAEHGVAAYYVDVTRRHRAQEGRDLVAAHDRSVAQTLQQVLLPSLSDIDGVNIVARYLTAENSAEVGGDWYDAIAGAGGRLSVMIGDVAGHDINAAATMGQLRSMLRMTAWDHDDEPSQIVTRLDCAARDLGIGTTASLVFVKIAPATADGGPDATASRSLQFTNAGHPPPIVVHPGGETILLGGVRADYLLGVDPRADRHDHSFEMPDGATLVLYTDGLIETRQHNIDDGIDRLRAALTRHHQRTLDDLLDAVIGDVVGPRPADDVAVIAVRFAGSTPRES